MIVEQQMPLKQRVVMPGETDRTAAVLFEKLRCRGLRRRWPSRHHLASVVHRLTPSYRQFSQTRLNPRRDGYVTGLTLNRLSGPRRRQQVRMCHASGQGLRSRSRLRIGRLFGRWRTSPSWLQPRDSFDSNFWRGLTAQLAVASKLSRCTGRTFRRSKSEERQSAVPLRADGEGVVNLQVG